MLMYEAAGIDVVETQSFLAADLYAPRSQAGYVVASPTAQGVSSELVPQ
jgi:hypothetical protein